MQVSELLSLLSSMSFGRETSTNKERSLYLKYLNLANLELWQIAVNANVFFQTIDVYFEDGENSTVLPDSYYIKAVFADKVQMRKSSLATIFNIPRGEYNIINNKIYTDTNALPQKTNPNAPLVFVPAERIKKYLTLLIVPNPKKLVEDIIHIDTETNIPVYPSAYHLALVHGALYYLYLSNKGFTEKLNHQVINWQEAKKSLANYYS